MFVCHCLSVHLSVCVLLVNGHALNFPLQIEQDLPKQPSSPNVGSSPSDDRSWVPAVLASREKKDYTPEEKKRYYAAKREYVGDAAYEAAKDRSWIPADLVNKDKASLTQEERRRYNSAKKAHLGEAEYQRQRALHKAKKEKKAAEQAVSPSSNVDNTPPSLPVAEGMPNRFALFNGHALFT